MPRIFDNILQLLTVLWGIIRIILPKRLQSSQMLDKSMVKTLSSKLKASWLQWPVERSGHGFRVFVVEPREYRPEMHALLFNAALKNLTEPPLRDALDNSSYTSETAQFLLNDPKDGRDRFDLITFPEAFLPKDDLLERLKCIRTPGCIHVGLRPSIDPARILFRTVEVRQLIDDIKENVLNIVEDDLKSITEWINDDRNRDQNFNIACLFTVDFKGKVRVCLHPKIVSAGIESTPLHDTNMHDADLYSLVTLLPTDNSFLSITIQPLICADALFIDADKLSCQPLQAISSADHFDNSPPDHIDIVSVTTCTEQKKHATVGRKWHQGFRDSFTHTIKLLKRHHSTVFILSNYNNISKSVLGGLSGVFLPIPLSKGVYPEEVTFSVYGRAEEDKDADNDWHYMSAKDLSEDGSKLSSLGYITAIAPQENGVEAAHMLGFTIYQLPRHSASWPSPKKNGLKAFTLRVANNNLGTVVFEKRY